MILQKISKVRWMASVQCLISWGGEFKSYSPFKRRSTPIPPLMLHGTLPSTAAVGWRYDSSWSSMTDDDDDDPLQTDRRTDGR